MKLLSQSVVLAVALCSQFAFSASGSKNSNKDLGLQQPVAQVNCDLNLQRCVYTPQNTSQSNLSNLIKDIKDTVFYKTDGEILGEGYIKIDNSTKSRILYWHDDESIRSRIEMAIKDYDQLADFSVAPGGYVDVNISVFAIDASGYDNFKIGLDSVLTNTKSVSALDKPATRFSSDMVGNAFSNIINLGNLTSSIIKLQFDLSRINSWSQMLQPYNRKIPNGDDINFSKKRTVWTDGTSAYKVSQDAGLGISGKVLVNRQDQRLVQIKGLSIDYGIETKESNSLVDKVSIYQGSLDLVSGIPQLIYSDELNISREQTQNNFIFSHGSSKDSVQSRILIFITATPVDNSKKSSDTDLGGLSSEQIQKLPEGDARSTQDILNSAKVSIAEGTMSDPFGQKLFLSIDNKKLTKKSFDKKIKVTIKNKNAEDDGNAVNTFVTDIQSLALLGVPLPPIKIEKDCKHSSSCEVIEYDVTLEADARVMSSQGVAAKVALRVQHIPSTGSIESKLVDAKSVSTRQAPAKSNGPGFLFGQ